MNPDVRLALSPPPLSALSVLLIEEEIKDYARKKIISCNFIIQR